MIENRNQVKEVETSFPYPSCEQDEINLMDYVKIIIKRRGFIIGLFLLAVIVAGTFSFFSPKVYQIDTILEVGKIGEEEIESPTQLVGKISGDVYGVIIRESLNVSELEYPVVKTENPKDTNIIKMAIESSKIDLAKNILNKKNELIILDHQGKVESAKTLLEKKIVFSGEDIVNLQKDIERIQIKIFSLEQEQVNLESKITALESVLVYQQDPGSQFALYDTKEKLEAKKQEIENNYLKINSLEKQINDIKTQIDSLENQIENIEPTSVVKEPTISENPVSPRPIFNMAIAGVLGLFVGIFVAFGKEWWHNSQ